VQAKAAHVDADDNDDSLDDVKYKIISSIYSPLHFTRTCLDIKPLLRGTNALCSWRVRHKRTPSLCVSVYIPAGVTELCILYTAKLSMQINISFTPSANSPHSVYITHIILKTKRKLVFVDTCIIV
jgi:hypothetical protein